MTTGALGTSAAHPLYLYVVFAACVLGAIALLISGWVAHRRSSWPRHWQTRSSQTSSSQDSQTRGSDTREDSAYPSEPAPVTLAVPEATATAPKKTAARKSTTTTATRTPAKKAAAAKKTTAKKPPRRKRSGE